MKEYGLYVWVNTNHKSWTTTNREDEILLSIAKEEHVKEYHFENVNSILEFEAKLDNEGYLYDNLGAFLIGV